MTEAAVVARVRDQSSIYLIGIAHGTTHWVDSSFLVLLPYLLKDLGLTYTAAGALVSGKHIMAVVANLGAGTVVDTTGRRVPLLVLALILTGSGLFLIGLTKVYLLIAVFFAVIGMANNGWHAPAMAYLSGRYPQQRSFAFAMHATGASVGDMVAPLAVGAWLTLFTWQGAALINALPVFAVALMLWLSLGPRESAERGARKAGMGMRAYGSSLWAMLRQRAVVALCLMAGLRSMAQSGLLVFLPLFLADVLKVSPVIMGASVMAMHLGGVIVTPFAGALADRIGARPVVMAGMTATTIVIAGITFVTHPLVYVAVVSVLGLVLYGVRPVVQAWLMNSSPPELHGTATSVMFGTQSALAVVMPVLGGVVADRYGLTYVFYLIAAVMLLANLTVLLLPRDTIARATAD
ncbi:MAG: MFS transporter [Candidatus Lambdaproteobacteria bacterium]|nr:MFS transporter [Candidatus Lambdaproteobacteria bacterium]